MFRPVNIPPILYQMQMVTNHDLNSWEGTEFERLGNLTEAFAVLSFTLPGMPLIYTGQETGMNRAFEFFTKDKAPQWQPRNRWFDFYRTLGQLKHTQGALAAGNPQGAMRYRYRPTRPDLYIFERTLGDSRVVVAVNLGSKPQKVKYTGDAPDLRGLTDIFSHEDASIPAELVPGAYRVFTTVK